LNTIWLAADDPTRARDEVIAAMTTWPRRGFHLQHYNTLVALAQIELYTREYEVAWMHVDGQLKLIEKSLLLRIQGLRIDATQLRARLALATAMGSDTPRRLQLAEKLAGQIEREKMAYATPMATLVRAAVAKKRGDQPGAANLLESAIRDFEASHMQLYATVGRRRLGELIGGDQGRELLAKTDRWMARQMIKNPARMTNLLAPGFP
jgi:hypothetical protein